MINNKRVLMLRLFAAERLITLTPKGLLFQVIYFFSKKKLIPLCLVWEQERIFRRKKGGQMPAFLRLPAYAINWRNT